MLSCPKAEVSGMLLVAKSAFVSLQASPLTSAQRHAGTLVRVRHDQAECQMTRSVMQCTSGRTRGARLAGFLDGLDSHHHRGDEPTSSL